MSGQCGCCQNVSGKYNCFEKVSGESICLQKVSVDSPRSNTCLEKVAEKSWRVQKIFLMNKDGRKKCLVNQTDQKLVLEKVSGQSWWPRKTV